MATEIRYVDGRADPEVAVLCPVHGPETCKGKWTWVDLGNGRWRRRCWFASYNIELRTPPEYFHDAPALRLEG
jgi:hypothetical protein